MTQQVLWGMDWDVTDICEAHYIYGYDKDGKFIPSFLAQAGIEWKINERLGFTVLGQYHPYGEDSLSVRVDKWSNETSVDKTPITSERADIFTVKLPDISFLGTLGYYF